MPWQPSQHFRHQRGSDMVLRELRKIGDQIMSALDDLNAADAAEASALAKLAGDQVQFLNDVASAVSGGVTAAQAADLVAKMQDRADQLDALDTSVTGADAGLSGSSGQGQAGAEQGAVVSGGTDSGTDDSAPDAQPPTGE
jgi:hypothetical protein